MSKIKNAIGSILGAIGSVLLILFIIVMWSANIRSCFTTNDVITSPIVK